MALTNSEIGGNVRYDRKEIRQETPSKMMGRKPFVDRPASPASDRTFATSLLHYLYPWTNPPPPKIFRLTVLANSEVAGYGRTDGSATWSNKSQIWAPSKATSDIISRNRCTTAMPPSSPHCRIYPPVSVLNAHVQGAGNVIQMKAARGLESKGGTGSISRPQKHSQQKA